MQRNIRARDRGQELWFILPESERTAGRLLEELGREGLKASKASVCRWAHEWRMVGHKAVDLIAAPTPTEPATPDELAGVPAELREGLPDRLLLLARGKALDRIENAICILSDGIARRADELVRDENHEHLRTAVGALAVMATAMERIAISRATVSSAHRSFCEGDRLLAEGERLRAEARKCGAEADVIAGARRTPSPREIDTAMQTYDLTFEDEAIIAMRELERSR